MTFESEQGGREVDYERAPIEAELEARARVIELAGERTVVAESREARAANRIALALARILDQLGPGALPAEKRPSGPITISLGQGWHVAGRWFLTRSGAAYRLAEDEIARLRKDQPRVPWRSALMWGGCGGAWGAFGAGVTPLPIYLSGVSPWAMMGISGLVVGGVLGASVAALEGGAFRLLRQRGEAAQAFPHELLRGDALAAAGEDFANIVDATLEHWQVSTTHGREPDKRLERLSQSVQDLGLA